MTDSLTTVVLEAALALRPRWLELLGEAGAAWAARLLADMTPENADTTATQVLDLFLEHHAVGELKESMPRRGPYDRNRAYAPLEGDQGPVPPPNVIYCCPTHRDEVWTPQVAGQPIPRCSRCNSPLVREDTERGT
jgi:hypothetical protein